MDVSISVIIPAWNAEHTIPECLGSLRSQTVQPHEVILVDDGSSDATREVSKEHSIQILSTGGRKGPATARNMGAEKATGSVLLFLDSDVVAPDDLLEKITARMKDESIWAVQTLYTQVCPASDPVSLYQNYYYHHSLARMQQGDTATFATWCSAVRRDKFLELGGFNVRIPEPTVEDEELGYTIADNGGRIYLDKSIQVVHLASYDLSQFTRRRMRMSRAQAKSGWRQVKERLLARYINVRESGTHHSRWVVLSILLVLWAQLALIYGTVLMNPAVTVGGLLLLAASLLCHLGFLRDAGRALGSGIIPVFILLSIYDMAVLGWGIVQGTVQFALGKRY